MQAVSLIKYSIKTVRLKTTNITRHKETFHKSIHRRHEHIQKYSFKMHEAKTDRYKE